MAVFALIVQAIGALLASLASVTAQIAPVAKALAQLLTSLVHQLIAQTATEKASCNTYERMYLLGKYTTSFKIF